jgi:RNA-binding protein
MPLTSKRRSELRAEAHTLSPVVIIGDKGLTDEVLAEIDRSLKTHELIKVRATAADRDAREIFFGKICEALGADEVQEIGKVLVVYRKNPEKEKARGTRHEALEKSEERRKLSKPLAPRGSRLKPVATGSGRPRSRTPSPRPASEPQRRRPRTSR